MAVSAVTIHLQDRFHPQQTICGWDASIVITGPLTGIAHSPEDFCPVCWKRRSNASPGWTKTPPPGECQHPGQT